MKIFISRTLRAMYRKLPLPLSLKIKVSSFIFRLLNFVSKQDRNNTKEFIEPVIKHADNYKNEHLPVFNFSNGKPLVSIVIPAFNKIDYTLRCLCSIKNETSIKEYEVIVVDDFSTDSTKDKLTQIPGLKYHRNTVNSGFVISCNNGAALAKGEYILFLNNDTVVMPGWLESLISVFDKRADAGLVGSMLLYPDGRLQEAGGIVWRDGSAWNYGRLSNPLNPEYNYLRKADYCSGACICLKTDLFNKLNGFDKLYAPAYYEDTDIAFRVRKEGYSVYYQPESKIIHFEGVSSGVDTTSGLKQYQIVNHKKFLDRWKTILALHNENAVQAEKERDRYAVKRVLVIDAWTPTPDKDSGSLRIFSLMQLMVSLDIKVVFVANDLAYDEKYTKSLQHEGIEVLYHPYTPSIKRYLRKYGHVFDCVLLSRANIADTYLTSVKRYCSNATIIFDTVDLHFIRESRHAALEGDYSLMKTAKQWKEIELNLVRDSHVTLVVSEYEKNMILSNLKDTDESSGSQIKILGNIHTVHGCRTGFENRSGMMFIGNFKHTPNVDAVEYFCKGIFPLIKKHEPGIEFFIVGSHVPSEIKMLNGDGVNVVGYVKDIESYFEKVKLSVAPLRYGAGVKGKINSSMSYGVPVVSTTIGIEGMGLNDDEVVVADEPDEFARAVLDIYHKPAVWEKLSKGGMNNIERNFSPRKAISVIDEICDHGATKYLFPGSTHI